MVSVEKVNEKVNWCIDDEINNLWKEVTEAIKIIVKQVLRKSIGRVRIHNVE